MDQAEQNIRVVFMGTPDFAAVILKYLLDNPRAEVVAAYTQPDRPCGRGQKCKPSPVKKLAMEHGIDVYQPENFKDPADVEQLRALKPDVLAVAAYGLILPQEVLDIPSFAPINVHASLLPKYRGAAPIQRVIQNGEHVTGITIMRMELGLDSGPVMLQRALRIAQGDHAGMIHDELAELGGLTMSETIDRILEGAVSLLPQDESLATYAPKLSKKEGLIDWDRPAAEVHDHIRAMHPWPGAYFSWKDAPGGKPLRLTLTPGKVGDELEGSPEPGTILGEVDCHVAIACRDKAYLAPTVKPEGKKAQDGQAFACSYLARCAEPESDQDKACPDPGLE